MKIKVFNSNFNGHIFETSYETDAIGVAVEKSDSYGMNYNIEISSKVYIELLSQYLDVNKNTNLYLILSFDKVGEFNAIERHNGIWGYLKKKE